MYCCSQRLAPSHHTRSYTAIPWPGRCSMQGILYDLWASGACASVIHIIRISSLSACGRLLLTTKHSDMLYLWNLRIYISVHSVIRCASCGPSSLHSISSLSLSSNSIFSGALSKALTWREGLAALDIWRLEHRCQKPCHSPLMDSSMFCLIQFNHHSNFLHNLL